MRISSGISPRRKRPELKKKQRSELLERNPLMRIFGREPVVVLNTLAAVLGLVVTLGITGLTAEQAGAIVGVATAVLGGIAAAMTRPVAPQAFTAIVGAGAVLVGTYGYEVSQETVGAINTVVLAALTLLTRVQVSPTPAKSPASGV
jgi:hypothetical protein